MQAERAAHGDGPSLHDNVGRATKSANRNQGADSELDRMKVFNTPARTAERIFIGGSAALALLILAVGFAKSYYLKNWFGTPALTTLLQWHGAVMTAWFILFAVQIGLVEIRQVRWHRRFGVFGIVVAGAVILLGGDVSWTAAVRETLKHAHDAPFFLILFGFEIFFLLPTFAVLVGTAIAYRRRRDIHKRLMLMATLALLGPPLVRVPLGFLQGNIVNSLLVIDLIVLSCVIVDSLYNRRLHPAFAWGGFLVVVGQHIAFFCFANETWVRIATNLVQSGR